VSITSKCIIELCHIPVFYLIDSILHKGSTLQDRFRISPSSKFCLTVYRFNKLYNDNITNFLLFCVI
jgi:hypothetical protein